MKKLFITKDELKQSLIRFNDNTLELLSHALCEATSFSRKDLDGTLDETPLHDILDSIWDAVLQEQVDRRVHKYVEQNLNVR